MFDIREPSIAALRTAPVKFRYGSNKRTILIDALTADAMTTCYDALSDEHKAKFERMIAASPVQLHKIVNFCWKHVKIGV
jgi:hypothetical protein